MILLIVFLITVFEHSNINLKIDKYNVEDYVINSHNFTYTLNPGQSVCFNQDVRILIYIHSSPKNLKYRQFVRETWSNSILFPNIRTVFTMGLTSDLNVNGLLKSESDEYHDIVQEDFFDSYGNLTIKALMAFKWIKDYCSNVDYIVKLDEDILMNTFALLDCVDELDSHDFKKENTIMCYLWKKAIVNKSEKSKWFVTNDDIQADIYLDYCAGAAYIFTPDLAGLYFNLSQLVNFFLIDDYYITGRVRSLTST
jgi:beta-1,3-galactosyltransferase 2